MPSRNGVAMRDLSFTFDAATTPLITHLSVHFPPGFTGVIGANGAGKTTLLRLLVGQLKPDSGSVEGVDHVCYCDQRTDDPPASLAEFLQDWDTEAFALRGRLGIDQDYDVRWHSLSHGERKRAQIGHALWRLPDVLVIDEPTNHIDAHARELLLHALRLYRGVGVIVSHDRQVLDELCKQCVWLDPPNATVYAGGYSSARQQRESQQITANRQRDKASKEAKRLHHEAVTRREHALKHHNDRSKQGLASKDSDAREKINRARNTDSKDGHQLRQIKGRVEKATTELQSARVEKAYDTGIWLPGSRSQRNTLLQLAAGEISLGQGRVLRWPDLTILPDDRIVITGPNGAGKSTFLRHVIPLLNVLPDRLVDMPQEIDAAAARALLAGLKQQSSEQLGHMMNIVSRLNSRPQRLLDSQQPSPGEVRKLVLAEGMSRAPHIIVMDEPTNHLDLPSIEALEAALIDCPCALLLISHDQHFIDTIEAVRWTIDRDAQAICC